MSEFSFFPDGQLDRMAGLVWQLAQELYVTRQRLLALEQVLAERGHLPEGAVDQYRPSDDRQARLQDDGAALMERLVRTISEVDDHRSPMRTQFEQQLAQVDQ